MSVIVVAVPTIGDPERGLNSANDTSDCSTNDRPAGSAHRPRYMSAGVRAFMCPRTTPWDWPATGMAKVSKAATKIKWVFIKDILVKRIRERRVSEVTRMASYGSSAHLGLPATSAANVCG